jgi:hypothetical protein
MNPIRFVVVTLLLAVAASASHNVLSADYEMEDPDSPKKQCWLIIDSVEIECLVVTCGHQRACCSCE